MSCCLDLQDDSCSASCGWCVWIVPATAAAGAVVGGCMLPQAAAQEQHWHSLIT
jgi:hypothetical protein